MLRDLRTNWAPRSVFVVPAVGRLVKVIEEDFYEFLGGALVISTITIENAV